MRGVVIVESKVGSEDNTLLLLATYFNGTQEEKGLIEVTEVPERDDLLTQRLLGGIVTPTGVNMVLAMPWSERFTNEQLEEVAVIGGDMQVFRITLSPAQLTVLRYHFNTIESGTAAAMMRRLPPFIDAVPGKPRTVVDGNFIPLRRFQKPGRLSGILGNEHLARLVLRQH